MARCYDWSWGHRCSPPPSSTIPSEFPSPLAAHGALLVLGLNSSSRGAEPLVIVPLSDWSCYVCLFTVTRRQGSTGKHCPRPLRKGPAPSPGSRTFAYAHLRPHPCKSVTVSTAHDPVGKTSFLCWLSRPTLNVAATQLLSISTRIHTQLMPNIEKN